MLGFLYNLQLEALYIVYRFGVAEIDARSIHSISNSEVLIAYGLAYPCKFLTFIKKVSEEYFQVWCEVVKKENCKEIEAIRLRENPHIQILKDSNSPDVLLLDRQRIKIDVKGNSMLGQELPRNHLLMNFMAMADGNHIFPPFRKKVGVHNVPYSTITYGKAPGGTASPLHSVTFDPWTMPKTIPKTSGDSTKKITEG